MNDPVIQTHQLTRYYGDKCAVDQVSMQVPCGQVTALLGRNGSGKSTLIRILVGQLEPTRGSASVLGDDCRKMRPETRGRIGYVAEGHPLIDWMRVRDLESFQRSFHAKWNERTCRSVMMHFDIAPTARAGQLSRGQRAGLSLALVLGPEPELLIMDDPALGLDPVARRTLLEAMIFVTRDAGHTILFSSHLLADVERVADRVMILDRSVLRANCSVETLRDRVRQLVLTFDRETPALPKIPGLLQARRAENEWRLVIANGNEATRTVVRSLNPSAVSETEVSLEDAVIGYLGDRRERESLLQAVGETPATGREAGMAS